MFKYITLAITATFIIIENTGFNIINAEIANIIKEPEYRNTIKQETIKEKSYEYPVFYRGIYLNVNSAKNTETLKKFINKAQESSINTFVMDVQSSKFQKSIIPAENVSICMESGIHPVARIVIFPGGLNEYPVREEIINEKIDIAVSACENGFREIQLDYIRFSDTKHLSWLSREKRYELIDQVISKIKNAIDKYDVKLSADVFGRIPLNRCDIIGQKMENLDKILDMICPMAYPSHYWTDRMRNDPYHTVFITSDAAKKRAPGSEIVSYIQAFQWKMPTNMTYAKYIEEQIRAVHDSGIKGFFLWNARQDYEEPLRVTAAYYGKKAAAENTEAGLKAEFN